MIFKRKIYGQMFAWKQENNGRSALLIEGARRIGKSTVVEQFAKNEYDSYILIDFNNASPSTYALFDDLTNLDMLFLQLQTEYKTVLKRRKSVVIFDEVQQCPKARQAIKYLVQDGRYDYIETGSLISIRRNTEYITIPSEEDRLEMYPMDYEEFLWAIGDEVTMTLLPQFWTQKKALGGIHRKIMRDLRLYMLVGGMPQAVNAYIEYNNFAAVDKVKRKILQLYQDDFRKLDVSGKIGRMFMSIPEQLTRNVSRYIPSAVVGSTSDEEKMAEILQALEESKTVNFVYQCNDPNVGMSLTRNDNCYKLFLADTGLFVTLAFWDKKFTDNVIYNKLLNDKLDANMGYVYENLVAQMLVAAGNRLFYHTWKKDEKHNYEIDFIISRGAKICPIEVKSSGYNRHASLDAFCIKYHDRIEQRYLLYTKDLMQDERTMLVPMYMIPFL